MYLSRLTRLLFSGTRTGWWQELVTAFVDGQPSLLVDWRQRNAGWEGRVISVVWADAVAWATVERWLPAFKIVRDLAD